MNDPDSNHTDSSAPRVGITDEEILAFIARVQAGGGRRHYVTARRPEESDTEPQ